MPSSSVPKLQLANKKVKAFVNFRSARDMENGLVFHRQSSLEYTRGSELGEEREYQRELQEYQRDKSSKNEQLAADLAALEITSSSTTSSYSSATMFVYRPGPRRDIKSGTNSCSERCKC